MNKKNDDTVTEVMTKRKKLGYTTGFSTIAEKNAENQIHTQTNKSWI